MTNVREWTASRGGGGGMGAFPGSGIMAIGNSLMTGDQATPGSSAPATIKGEGPLGWMVILSGRKLYLHAKPGGDAWEATGSTTIQQILGTETGHGAAILETRPSLVLVGPLMTNNPPTDDAAAEETQKGLYRDFIDNCLSVGTVPIILSEYPNGGGSIAAARGRYQAERINAWLERLAYNRGVPYVDAYGTLTDPTTKGRYKAAYSDDGLHNNRAGAKAIAQKAIAVLQPLLAELPDIYLAEADETYDPVTGAGVLVDANPLNAGAGVPGTTAAALPTGWSVRSTVADQAFDTSAADNAGLGKWLKNTGTGSNIQSSTFTINDGDRMFLAFDIEVAHTAGTSNGAMRLITQDGGLNVGVNTPDDMAGTYAAEWTHVNSGGNLNRFVQTTFGAGVSTRHARRTLINLTQRRVLPV